MSIASDARALVTGFGSVLVDLDGTTTRGLFDDDDSVVGLSDGSSVLVRSRQLLITTGALPDLSVEDTLNVGLVGDDATRTAYRVVDIQRQADGALLVVRVAT